MLISQRLLVAGCRFNYLEGGPAGGGALPPVVFLHGWASAAYAFTDSLECLARQRHLIAPDLPGFNQSRCSTAGWTYSDYADAICGLTQALKLEAFHLVGHSTGGGVGIVLAADHPQTVRSLTLIDSAGVPLGSLLRPLLRKTLEEFQQAWATGPAPQHIPLVTAAIFNFLFRTRNTWNSLRLPLRLDLRPRLASVSMPCQVVWGEKDATEPLALGQMLAAGLPGAALVCLPGVYHEWSVLRPQLFADTVLSFIQRVESAAPAGRQAPPLEIG